MRHVGGPARLGRAPQLGTAWGLGTAALGLLTPRAGAGPYRAPTVPLPCRYHAPTMPLPCRYRAATAPLPCTAARRSAALGLDYDCQFAKPAASRAGCKDVAILLDPQAG